MTDTSTLNYTLAAESTYRTDQGAAATRSTGTSGSQLTRLIRGRVLRTLSRLEQGSIALTDGDVSSRLGKSGSDELAATLEVVDHRFYKELALGGGLGFAESYLRGHWNTDDLTQLMQVFSRNLSRLSKVNGGVARFGRVLSRLGHRLSRNSRNGSRRNVASHYDLSNQFFATFLDPTMMYSSARFEESDSSLERASVAKLEAICRRLDLQPGDHVIEIGTGWGGFAVHAAQNYGCRVTTTTISRQQYGYARERIDVAGLADRVTLLFNDYRDLSGKYEKLVSIEMLEAVGHQYFETYFRKCDRLLKPGGRMVVQTITIPEQRYKNYIESVDFIQKYIFPGGCLPSLAAIQQAVGITGDLRLVEQDDFGLCYARTLREWRHRFFNGLSDVRRLGFDERFIRMWEYYFCYCEAAFLERAVGVSQLAWIKTGRTAA